MPFDISGVGFSYPKAEGQSLQNFTASIRPGTTTAVVGESGSGKSTLLNLLGLLWEGPTQSGKITYHDGKNPHDYATLSRRERTALRLHEFGFVLQSSWMLPHLTCGENASVPLALQQVPPEERSRRIDDLLRQAEPHGKLLALRDRPARKVSGGEGQRIAVVRALAHDPRVVFADEPVSSLDRRNAAAIRDMLCRWKRGEFGRSKRTDRTLVLVNHDIESTWAIADDFLVLRRGRLVGAGSKSDFPRGPDQIQELMFEDTHDGVGDDPRSSPEVAASLG